MVWTESTASGGCRRDEPEPRLQADRRGLGVGGGRYWQRADRRAVPPGLTVDRSFWLSILVLLLAVTLVMTGRAVLEAAKGLQGEALLAEIEVLAGRPSSVELAERVTEAAGCVRGFRPEVRSCWYAWAEPTRPDYLRVVAERVRADGTGEAIRWSALASRFGSWQPSRRGRRPDPSVRTGHRRRLRRPRHSGRAVACCRSRHGTTTQHRLIRVCHPSGALDDAATAVRAPALPDGPPLQGGSIDRPAKGCVGPSLAPGITRLQRSAVRR